MERVTTELTYIGFILSSYIVASISFGLLIGKFSKGIDIREYGSGSTGATNVARNCGTGLGILALILDMGKAAIPLYTAMYLVETPEWSHPVIGLSAIAGHSWPLFTNFKGGKGIASGWSALIVLSPVSGIVAIIAAAPIMVTTRYVSLGFMVGSGAGGICIVIISLTSNLPDIYCIYGFIGSSVTIVLHHKNILRLLRGEESKFGKSDTTETGNKI